MCPLIWLCREAEKGKSNVTLNPQPAILNHPSEAYLRVIDEPVLRLASVDLGVVRRHYRIWTKCSILPAIIWDC